MSDQPYQQPYQPQPYGRGIPRAQPHPQGTVVLVLGILGFFITICAPFAWYFGSKALKEIQASGVRYSNEDQIRVGRILGMIISILAIIGLVFGLIFVIIAAVLAATSR